jgi:hypothetical protein
VEPRPTAVSGESSEAFSRISRVASRLLNAAIVIIVANENGQATIVSHVGIDAHLIDPSGLLADPRESPSPLLAGKTYIRRVTGAVLSATDGRQLGTLWVLDERQHMASAYDEQNLADVAALAEREFEFSRATAAPVA